MSEKKVSCDYLMEDGRSCSAVASKEVKNIREHDCSSNSKELCCYLCVSRVSCEIGCAFLDKKEERRAQEDPVVPTEVLSALILEENEKVLGYWRGRAEVVKVILVQKGEYFKRGEFAEVKGRLEGSLVLTDTRLVWMRVRGKSNHVAFEVPLEHIKGISEGNYVFSDYVSVISEEGECRLFLHFDQNSEKSDLVQFTDMVRPAIQSRKKEIEAKKRKERVHIMIEFSAIKDFLAKGGLTLQAIKCPECGARLKLPQAGNRTKCEHCGHEIYAQDIFDKMKDIIT